MVAMVAHVAELCRVFTSQCCAMIKIRSPAFFSSSSSPSAPFQTPSRSPKIKDTTERAAAPSPDLFRLRSRSLAPQSVQQLLRQTFSDSEVGV